MKRFLLFFCCFSMFFLENTSAQLFQTRLLGTKAFSISIENLGYACLHTDSLQTYLTHLDMFGNIISTLEIPSTYDDIISDGEGGYFTATLIENDTMDAVKVAHFDTDQTELWQKTLQWEDNLLQARLAKGEGVDVFLAVQSKMIRPAYTIAWEVAQEMRIYRLNEFEEEVAYAKLNSSIGSDTLQLEHEAIKELQYEPSDSSFYIQKNACYCPIPVNEYNIDYLIKIKNGQQVYKIRTPLFGLYSAPITHRLRSYYVHAGKIYTTNYIYFPIFSSSSRRRQIVVYDAITGQKLKEETYFYLVDVPGPGVTTYFDVPLLSMPTDEGVLSFSTKDQAVARFCLFSNDLEKQSVLPFQAVYQSDFDSYRSNRLFKACPTGGAVLIGDDASGAFLSKVGPLGQNSSSGQSVKFNFYRDTLQADCTLNGGEVLQDSMDLVLISHADSTSLWLPKLQNGIMKTYLTEGAYTIKRKTPLLDSLGFDCTLPFDFYLSGNPNFAFEHNFLFTDYQLVRLKKQEDSSAVSLYPNPTNGQLFFTGKVSKNRPATYKIRSIAGLEMPVFSNLENSLDVSHLPAGFYTLEITEKNGERKVLEFEKI